MRRECTTREAHTKAREESRKAKTTGMADRMKRVKMRRGGPHASGPQIASLLADVAQLVEQLIRNEQVIGSNPIVGSISNLTTRTNAEDVIPHKIAELRQQPTPQPWRAKQERYSPWPSTPTPQRCADFESNFFLPACLFVFPFKECRAHSERWCFESICIGSPPKIQRSANLF